MNYLDLILFVVLIVSCLVGYKRGFINSVFSLAKWIIPFFTGLFFYADVSVILNSNFIIQTAWLHPLSFFVLFSLAFLVMSFLIFLVKKYLNKVVQNNLINSITGIVPGFITGIIFTLIIARLISSSSLPLITTEAKKSYLYALFDNSAKWVDNDLADIFNVPVLPKTSVAYEAGSGLNESEEYKSDVFISRPDFENQLLQLVNGERIKNGLKPLIADIKMQEVALEHAKDMFKRGYFSHSTPEGTNPFQRMEKRKIKFLFAGENLAHSFDLISAHNGLMESPGHRANILNPGFGKLGISILDAGNKGLMLVQEFRD